jgi:hypothetical protein
MKTAILTLAIASLAYSSSGQATATYTVTEISVSGARFVRANQINDFGLVVGTWEDFQGRRAFTWSQSGGLFDLNAELGATLSSASALNNSGVIVGQARIGGVDQGYRWSQGTGTQFLAKLTDRTPEPYSINELGQVGGSSMESTGTRAVRWSETGAAQDLGGQLGAFSRIISFRMMARWLASVPSAHLEPRPFTEVRQVSSQTSRPTRQTTGTASVLW